MSARPPSRVLPPLCLLLAGAALILAAPARAASPEDTRTAQRKTQEGARQLENGKAEEALRLFQEAFVLTENVRYQYNIGVASSALGRDADALDAFERFAAGARGITREHRRDVESKIDALKKRVAELEISAPEPGVDVRLDGLRLGATPLPRLIRATAGAHALSATKPGFLPYDRRLELTRGTRTRVELLLTPVPSAVVPPPAAHRPIDLTARPEPTPKPPIVHQKVAPPDESIGGVWLWTGIGAVIVAGAVLGIVLATRGGSNPMCPPDVDQCIK